MVQLGQCDLAISTTAGGIRYDLNMIRHSVYFRFTSDATAEERVRHMDDFASLESLIPAIAGYEAGDVFAGPDAKGDAPAFHVAHQVLFESREDLEAYIPHPAHREFIERNRTSWEDVLVVDVVIRDRSVGD